MLLRKSDLQLGSRYRATLTTVAGGVGEVMVITGLAPPCQRSPLCPSSWKVVDAFKKGGPTPAISSQRPSDTNTLCPGSCPKPPRLLGAWNSGLSARPAVAQDFAGSNLSSGRVVEPL